MQYSFIYLQNVLRELEQKKPQLDELVHTAENLRADTNRQQLHGKGKFFIFLLLLCIKYLIGSLYFFGIIAKNQIQKETSTMGLDIN